MYRFTVRSIGVNFLIPAYFGESAIFVESVLLLKTADSPKKNTEKFTHKNFSNWAIAFEIVFSYRPVRVVPSQCIVVNFVLRVSARSPLVSLQLLLNILDRLGGNFCRLPKCKSFSHYLKIDLFWITLSKNFGAFTIVIILKPLLRDYWKFISDFDSYEKYWTKQQNSN